MADINPQRLQQFGDEWEIDPQQRYPTAVDMYEKAGLDVVSVTTHNLYHHQPVIDAAAAGIKVIMVEKPLAISVALGRKMVAACERSGSRLITEHTRRFLPHYRRLKRMIDEGAVGQIKTIKYERLPGRSSTTAPIRLTMPSTSPGLNRNSYRVISAQSLWSIQAARA